MINIVSKFNDEAIAKIKDEFNLENPHSVPAIEKIVLNAGVGDALTNKDALAKVQDQLSAIAGQRAKIAKAKKSISNFKLKKGDPIGAMVTLRGKKTWYFLEKLIAVVIPRMRDFRGLSPAKFDAMGNYNLGISEQILFPEIDYAKIDKIRGLVVTIVIKNSNIEKSKRLLELLGLPFRQEQKS